MIKKTMEVNAVGPMLTMKEFLPEMLKKNKGHVVTISSVSSFVGVPEAIEYSASKAAATQIDECFKLLVHNSKKNIKSTCICPFFINTGMFEGAKGITVSGVLEQEYVVNRIIQAI
mmetsp:Transcript_37807/g.27846  ORF Transcript_37807/g.27846 Transcript_37807/m.27846 type:complete len:116 (+) Transcript_37807:223-570(+)|eukprot:CAMPEP_0202960484 /NCGR_PEP_ID=MMETSP1396-20130829/4619_1 /ASSEMBLY_ACC=CAM_ASM_000872 /TAXON_ID= /ORGANISM="Pseudokeronopsis sp., Strain Brazil" /LENGTH=115 /DNA_ID=CAMNT_0049679719 /DNA_START=508 /DNA_END=855 /DNA_ORIENTATION=+